MGQAVVNCILSLLAPYMLLQSHVLCYIFLGFHIIKFCYCLLLKTIVYLIVPIPSTTSLDTLSPSRGAREHSKASQQRRELARSQNGAETRDIRAKWVLGVFLRNWFSG
jgi:hypothetical protein